jgi:hypothetical protein
MRQSERGCIAAQLPESLQECEVGSTRQQEREQRVFLLPRKVDVINGNRMQGWFRASAASDASRLVQADIPHGRFYSYFNSRLEISRLKLAVNSRS